MVGREWRTPNPELIRGSKGRLLLPSSIPVSAMFHPGVRVRHGPRFRGGGARGVDPWLLVVLFQAFQRFQAMERKPPVTIGLIVACAVAFVVPEQVGAIFGARTVDAACLQPYSVVLKAELMRLLSCSWFHGDEISLAYNASSLLWKGYQLETRMGSETFAMVTVMLSVLSSACAVITAGVLSLAFQNHDALYACTYGLSPLLFALKVVLYNDPDAGDARGNVSFFGLVDVPKRWAALAEMGLLHLMHPSLAMLNVHAGGALAGFTYVHRHRILRQLARFSATAARAAEGTGAAPRPPPRQPQPQPQPRGQEREMPPQQPPQQQQHYDDATLRRRAAAAAAARAERFTR